jgi:hypothetical protein
LKRKAVDQEAGDQEAGDQGVVEQGAVERKAVDQEAVDQKAVKLSDMTMVHLAEWCHVQPDDVRLPTAWKAAVAAVLGHTNLSLEEADEAETLVFPAIAIASSMIYDPGMLVDSGKLNMVAGSLMGLYDRNFLPKGADGA